MTPLMNSADYVRVEVAPGVFIKYVDDLPVSAIRICLVHDFLTFLDAPTKDWNPLVVEQYDNCSVAGLAKWVVEVVNMTSTCCRKVA